MARNGNATLLVQSARFFTGNVGTAAPSDLKNPGPEWTEIGHTSPDEILSWASEGGEQTILGSLQSPSLRTTSTARTESASITLLQWDEATLPFYFGADMQLISGSQIFMGVKNKPTPVKKALLIVIEDGENLFGIYAPSTEIGRGDDLSLDSTEELSGLPVNITFMQHNGNDWGYAITPIKPAAAEAEGVGVGG